MSTTSDQVVENTSGWSGSQTWTDTAWPESTAIDAAVAVQTADGANAETGAADDTTSGGLLGSKSISETGSGTESSTGALAQVSSQTEVGAAAETESGVPIYGGSMSETGVSDDAPSGIQTANAQEQDNGIAADQVSGATEAYRESADIMVPVDLTSGATASPGDNVEQLIAEDEASGLGAINGALVENRSANTITHATKLSNASSAESVDMKGYESGNVLKSVYNVEPKKTALQRMLDYPHAAVFDKDPDQVLAFLISHPNRAQWTVSDRVMTAWAGNNQHTYNLSSFTVTQLVAALRSDGFSVTRENADLSGLSAAVLVESRGDEWMSFGREVYAFTSQLWAMMSVYTDDVAIDGSKRISDALAQMLVPTAEGYWLDLWAALFGSLRGDGETDASLRQDIPEEAFRLRCNALAIEKTIYDELGVRVKIREPWKEIFRLDQSSLSGTDAFQNSTYYSPFYIQPVSATAVDWAAVLRVIDRNRAAGVFVYDPALEMPPSLVDAGILAHTQIADAITWDFTAFARALGEVPLGEMILDDNHFTFNHEHNAYQLQSYANLNGLNGSQELLPIVDIAYASVTLSDGVPLGDENAALGMWSEFFEFDPEPVLSDELSPSEYSVDHIIDRIERIYLDDRSQLVTSAIAPGGSGGLSSEVRWMGLVSYGADLYQWTGGWDSRTWMSRGTISVTSKMTNISA